MADHSEDDEAVRTPETPMLLNHGTLQSVDAILSGLPSYSSLDPEQQRACCAFLVLTSDIVVKNKEYKYYLDGMNAASVALSQVVALLYMMHLNILAMPTERIKELMARVVETEMLAENARLAKRMENAKD